MKWDSYLLSQLSYLQRDRCLTIVSPFQVRSRLQFFGTDEHEPTLNRFCFYIRQLFIIIAVLKVFTVKNTKPYEYKKQVRSNQPSRTCLNLSLRTILWLECLI